VTRSRRRRDALRALTHQHASPAGGCGVRPGDVPTACSSCLRRSWLLARLGGWIERARHADRGRLRGLLALDDEGLMRALGALETGLLAEYRSFAPASARHAIAGAGLVAVCRHDEAYPEALRGVPDAPAALHVAGRWERFVAFTQAERPVVAVVGARRASPYGLEVARAIGRGLAAAGVPVVSGMALGIDAAAQAGALEVHGPTVAVLAGGAERAYPSSKRLLHARLRESACVVSEMPPGATSYRWGFPARNRIIAGLARLTVVVEARERSGSLITAEMARDLGREVGAVPGRVTSPLAAGTNALLKDGAHVIRDAQDALDLACGVGNWSGAPGPPELPEPLGTLLEAVAEGRDTVEALAAAGRDIGDSLAGLAELELIGRVRRVAGGRYVPVA